MIQSLENAVRIADIPRYWAQVTPDAPALFEDGLTVTYGAMWKSVQQAGELLKERGVRPGDRVLLVTENCAAQVVLLLAVSALGAWPVNVNARLSEREVESIRAHCQPRLALLTTGVSPDARAHARRWEATDIVAGGFDGLAISATNTQALPEPPEVAEKVAALIYTSGTTGMPKGVMVTHSGLLHFAGVSGKSRRLCSSDIALGVLPISHIFGLATLLTATMHAGASVCLQPRFTPEGMLDALENKGLSILQGVPTMYTRLLSHLRETGHRINAPRLRYIYTGGAALDPALKQAVESAFGLPLHHGYGMTEYAGSLVITDIDRPRSDCSPGRITVGAELKTVDEFGNDLPAGTPGEIWVRGPGVMLGYYRSPESTAQALRPGGWLNTGDLGRVDEEGVLFILGRTKDLIIRSGFNVYPQEVESVINDFPGVKQSAVVGRITEDSNEEVIAFIEPHTGETVDTAALRGFLKTRLSPYKLPAEIRLIDAIPTTASGKLLKNSLRKMATGQT